MRKACTRVRVRTSLVIYYPLHKQNTKEMCVKTTINVRKIINHAINATKIKYSTAVIIMTIMIPMPQGWIQSLGGNLQSFSVAKAPSLKAEGVQSKTDAKGVKEGGEWGEGIPSPVDCKV